MMLAAAALATAALAVPTPHPHAAANSSSAVILNNGLTFPLASFGLQVYDDTTATAYVTPHASRRHRSSYVRIGRRTGPELSARRRYTNLALAAGFRNFFSSVLAGNQAGFGAAIKGTKVPRKEIFICGSVNTGNGQCSGTAQCQQATAQGCTENLQAIGVDYLDMIMLDCKLLSLLLCCLACVSDFVVHNTCQHLLSAYHDDSAMALMLLQTLRATALASRASGLHSKRCWPVARQRASQCRTSRRSSSTASYLTSRPLFRR
jgi:hypothetical protein